MWGVGGACGGPCDVFGAFGARSERTRLRVGLCEARVWGMGGACGFPRYVFGTFGARLECPRLRVGVCEARVRGVGGACGDPRYVFGALGMRQGCSKLCAGLCEASVPGMGGACGAPPYVFGTLGTRPECPRLYFGLERPQFTRWPKFTPMGKRRLRWGGRTRRTRLHAAGKEAKRRRGCGRCPGPSRTLTAAHSEERRARLMRRTSLSAPLTLS